MAIVFSLTWQKRAGIVLHALQHLYETKSPKTSFTVQEIEQHARKLYSVLEEEKISLDLSLIGDLKLMMLGGWNNDAAVITEVHVREDVINFPNIEDFWSQALLARLPDRAVKSAALKNSVGSIPFSEFSTGANLTMMQ